jgi:hypothetical protein
MSVGSIIFAEIGGELEAASFSFSDMMRYTK